MSTTWAPTSVAGMNSVLGTCTTGTEGPPSAAGDGMDLTGLRSVAIFFEASGALAAGGGIHIYLYNLASTNWDRAPDLEPNPLPTGWNENRMACPGFTVEQPFGRVCAFPSGMGIAGTITLLGGRALR